MMFSPNPGVLAAGAGASKTYAEWQAHIAAISDSIPQDTWTGPTPGMKRTTLANGTGGMFGTSWKSFFLMEPGLNIAAPRRIIQHGMPDEATFNAQRLAGREVLLRLNYYGHEQFYTPRNRNGFISNGGDMEAVYQAYSCDLVAWFDPDAGQALATNPLAGTGPALYSAPGW